MFFSRNRRLASVLLSLIAIADTADAPEAPAMQMATMTERIMVLELRQVANRRAPWTSTRRPDRLNLGFAILESNVVAKKKALHASARPVVAPEFRVGTAVGTKGRGRTNCGSDARARPRFSEVKVERARRLTSTSSHAGLERELARRVSKQRNR